MSIHYEVISEDRNINPLINENKDKKRGLNL